MAKFCEICKEKIGTPGGSVTLPDGEVFNDICGKCSEHIQQANVSNVPEGAPTIRKRRDDSAAFLAAVVLSGSVDARLAEYLRSISAVSDSLETEQHSRVLATSGYSFDGHTISSYMNVISADVVIGTGVVAETLAGLSDLAGTTSNAIADKVTIAKNMALAKLYDRVKRLGANAVVGVAFDVYPYGSMLGVSASGTAVVIE